MLDCRGRDLWTDAHGDGQVHDAVAFELRIDYTGSGAIVRATGHPVVEALVGQSALGGFRRFVATGLAGRARPGTLLALLLDEVPVVTMISRAALSDREVLGFAGARPPSLVNVCSGWREDGRLASAVAATGLLPVIDRPPAPALEYDGWHELRSVLPPGSMRRLRRFDLGTADPATGSVESLFRDSLSHAEQGHVVVHEYGVTAQIAVPAKTITAIDSQPHVLPAPECPVAAASAGRLVGRPVAELRELVRQDFVGTSTCTHLNDHLRALGDLALLLDITSE